MSLNAPEQIARQQIDQQLQAAGWAVQDYRQFHPSVASATQCGAENSIEQRLCWVRLLSGYTH